MIKSLFDQKENAEVVNRINQLSPQTKALWGKMNVSQMLKHAQQPLLVACGDLKLKRGLIGILLGSIAKKQLLKTEPFGKNLPTVKEFQMTGKADALQFEEEKLKLISLIQEFERSGPAGLTKDPHPFFGNLNPDEWNKLQWKHLDHHLRQFGV